MHHIRRRLQVIEQNTDIIKIADRTRNNAETTRQRARETLEDLKQFKRDFTDAFRLLENNAATFKDSKTALMIKLGQIVTKNTLKQPLITDDNLKSLANKYERFFADKSSLWGSAN